MSPIPEFSQFVHRVDGTIVLVPCVSFVVFLNETDDAGLLDFYHRCREALGDRITHYQAASMKAFSRLDARGNAMVPTWFSQPRRGKVDYYMTMSEGDPNEEVGASRIELDVFRRPASEWTPEGEAKELAKREKAFDNKRFIPPLLASRLRVTLPIDHLLAEPDRLREWALCFEIIRTGSVFSAYVSYALNYYQQAAQWNLYAPAEQLLASTCLQHPGFDWDGGGLIPRVLRFQPSPPSFLPLVKRAAWLNVICDKTVTFLGGRDSMRSRLRDEPAISVHDLQHGVAIQAGPTPQVGDLGHRDFVPLVRRVAGDLRPVRVREIDGLGGGFMKDATNDWLSAFDKTYD